MRINKFIATATGISRRAADAAISSGRVRINGHTANLGDSANPDDDITLDGQTLQLKHIHTTLMLNKPAGFVVSRNGQGNRTIYDLLPAKYHRLKPIGRLDKDSSGLLLLTDDGELANELSHPRYQKEKVYRIKLNKNISESDKKQLLTGVKLSDGMSKFVRLIDCSNQIYEVILVEGKNRQIRRTFNALGYKIDSLHRIAFGSFTLPEQFEPGRWDEIPSDPAAA